MTNSTHDFLAIEFPGVTPAEAAILVQECAAKLREAGIDPASIQIARTNQETMDLGCTLLMAGGGIVSAFFKGALEGMGGEAGKAIYEKIRAALETLSRRHRTAIQIKDANGKAETIGRDFQTVAPSGKAGLGLSKLGIVLLGASEFPYMNDPTLNNAAFARSAALAKKLFSPPFTAFAKAEVLDLFDKEMQPLDVLDAIEQHIDAHPDMHDLLIYYCGHGNFQKDNTYFLLLRSTRVGREGVTGFAPRTFRQDLEPRLTDKRVYFVVDCCFSGAFVESLQSGSLERAVEDQLSLDLPQRGWTVLTASAKEKYAMAPKGETYTMFTGALAHVIERGTGTAGVRFNFRDLTDEAGAYVTTKWQRQAVIPQCISPRQPDGDIARLPVFLNKHPAQVAHSSVGGDLPGTSGAHRSKQNQADPAEREWDVLGLDTCIDPGLLLAYAGKWEKHDQVWAYRARKRAENVSARGKRPEAETRSGAGDHTAPVWSAAPQEDKATLSAGSANPDELYRRGQRLSSGLGVAEDPVLAARLYREAADAGHVQAMVALANAYRLGRGVKQDATEAMRLLHKSAEMGNPDAIFYIGLQTEYGEGVAENNEEAMRLYRKAMELGSAEAAMHLAEMYEKGEVIRKDTSEAERLYRKAATLGVEDGNIMGRLGQRFQEIGNLAEAVKYFRAGSELNDGYSMWHLGDMYLEGKGVPEDEAEALRLFRKAVGLVDTHILGCIVRSVEYFGEEEVFYFTKENAKLGCVFSKIDLADMYAEGRGVAKNEAEAVRLYRECADVDQDWGHPSKCLADMYANGRGVARDETEAVRLYRKAIELGDSRAVFSLAEMLEWGRGVPRNPAGAAALIFRGLQGDSHFHVCRDDYLRKRFIERAAETAKDATWSEAFRKELQSLMKQRKAYSGPIDGSVSRVAEAVKVMCGIEEEEWDEDDC